MFNKAVIYKFLRMGKKTMNVEAFFVLRSHIVLCRTVRLYCLYAQICFWILFNEKRMRRFDRRRNIYMKFCACLLVWREKESKMFIHVSIENIYWKLTCGGAAGLVVTTRLNGIGELRSNSFAPKHESICLSPSPVIDLPTKQTSFSSFGWQQV